jgi:hypothetical protein
LVFSLGAKDSEVEIEKDTERSVSCMKRARQGPNQKLKLCSRLRRIAAELAGRALLNRDAIASHLAIFLSA